MFVEVEGGRLINLDLVSWLELDHRNKKASAWDSGIVMHSDSEILYDLFMEQKRDDLKLVDLDTIVKRMLSKFDDMVKEIQSKSTVD